MTEADVEAKRERLARIIVTSDVELPGYRVGDSLGCWETYSMDFFNEGRMLASASRMASDDLRLSMRLLAEKYGIPAVVGFQIDWDPKPSDEPGRRTIMASGRSAFASMVP